MSTDSSSFQEFFDRWLVEQNLHLEDLISATTAQRPATQFLRDLAGQVMQHYEEYYQAKSAWAHQDVLDVLSPSWRTSLEEAFLWIGGWRPSTAFHLLYSKSGLQLETLLHDADDMGHRNGAVTNLAGLSTTQFHMINELHKNTIKEERRLTEKMTKVQESIADASVVDLSHTVSEMIRRTEEGEGDVAGPMSASVVMNERVERALVPKKRKMEELLRKADDLRLTTIRSIVDDILTPIQAVHFLIALAELHLRVHDWGKQRDDQC